jgi:hypothetical protein
MSYVLFKSNEFLLVFYLFGFPCDRTDSEVRLNNERRCRIPCKIASAEHNTLQVLLTL